jgi:hypothetical protein
MLSKLADALQDRAIARVNATIADVASDYFIITGQNSKALDLLNERDDYYNVVTWHNERVNDMTAGMAWDKLMRDSKENDAIARAEQYDNDDYNAHSPFNTANHGYDCICALCSHNRRIRPQLDSAINAGFGRIEPIDYNDLPF